MFSYDDTVIEQFGKFLPAVKIGDRLWLKDNLDCSDYGDGIICNGTCYYTWDAAKRIASKLGGWHLPTVQEWNDACEILGYKNVGYDRFIGQPSEIDEPCLKFYSGCSLQKVLDIYPLGYYMPGGKFTDVGWSGLYWTATDKCFWEDIDSSDTAFCRSFRKPSDDGIVNSSRCPKTYYFPVRLVKDMD